MPLLGVKKNSNLEYNENETGDSSLFQKTNQNIQGYLKKRSRLIWLF